MIHAENSVVSITPSGVDPGNDLPVPPDQGAVRESL